MAEGIPVTVDINVGTAANTLRTRSALLENEERKIYDLYLWVFNASGDVDFHVNIPGATFIRRQATLRRPQAKLTATPPRAWDF